MPYLFHSGISPRKNNADQLSCRLLNRGTSCAKPSGSAMRSYERRRNVGGGVPRDLATGHRSPADYPSERQTGAIMPTTKPEGQSTVVAVYPDHDSADDAVRRLQSDGIPLQNLSIIGMDFQSVEKPLGFVTTGDVAKTGSLDRRTLRAARWGGVCDCAGNRTVGDRRAVGGDIVGRYRRRWPGRRSADWPARSLAWVSPRTRRSATNPKSGPASSWSSCKATRPRSSEPNHCSPSAKPRRPRLSKRQRHSCKVLCWPRILLRASMQPIVMRPLLLAHWLGG